MRDQTPASAGVLLFVPGNTPRRFAKAIEAPADLIIFDLEDAVAPEQKDLARESVHGWIAAHGHDHVVVRINADGTCWHDDDIGLARATGCAVMIPKAEDADALAKTCDALGADQPVIALIETARGVRAAADVSAVPGVVRMAFGSIDLAAELGIDHDDRAAMLHARSTLVIAAAAAGLAPPIDGVTTAVRDDTKVSDDVRYARSLGMTGKLCIHPAQLAPARRALAPTPEEIAWATAVVAAARAGHGAVAVDGRMVDKPVVDRANRLLQLASTPRERPDYAHLEPR